MPEVGAVARPDLLLRRAVRAASPTGDRARRGALQVLHRRREATATIKLNKPFAGFISALSLPAFSMQSPTALEEYQDDARRQPDAPPSTPRRTRPAPARSSSTRGTAASRSRSKRNDDYWGDKAQHRRGRSSSRSTTPRPAPTRSRTVRSTASTWSARPTSRRWRTTASRSSNRAAVQRPLPGHEPEGRSRSTTSGSARRSPTPSTRTRSSAPRMPEGTEAAPRVHARPSSTATPRTSRRTSTTRRRPRSCSSEAGAEGATIEFNYPTGVSRPYMPQPEDTFNVHPHPARGGRPQDQARPPTSGTRTTWTRSRARRTTASTCSAGPATTTTPTTSSACSSAQQSHRVGLRQPASCSTT